jgi:YD repeat-containing protein
LVGVVTDGFCYCKAPYNWSEKDNACILEQDIDRTKKIGDCRNPAIGNPIYPATGTKQETGGHRHRIASRSHGAPRSRAIDALRSQQRRSGLPSVDLMPFGGLWLSSLHKRIEIGPGRRGARASRGDGRVISFTGNGAGAFTADVDINDRLLSVAGGYDTWTRSPVRSRSTTAIGVLNSLVGHRRSKLRLRLQRLQHPVEPRACTRLSVETSGTAFGRVLGFEYSPSGRVARIIDPAGSVAIPAYDSASNLSQITWADRTRTYLPV